MALGTLQCSVRAAGIWQINWRPFLTSSQKKGRGKEEEKEEKRRREEEEKKGGEEGEKKKEGREKIDKEATFAQKIGSSKHFFGDHVRTLNCHYSVILGSCPHTS